MKINRNFLPKQGFEPKYTQRPGRDKGMCRYWGYAADGTRKRMTVYFAGAFNSNESLSEFESLKKLMATLVYAQSETPAPKCDGSATIAQLAALWLQSRERATSTREELNKCIKVARYLLPYSDMRVSDFKKQTLNAIRKQIVAEASVTDSKSRPYINTLVSKIRGIFNFGAAEGLVSEMQEFSLANLKPLSKTDAPKLRGRGFRRAADIESVEKAIEHASPTLAMMLTLQLAAGMRPKELFVMKESEIDKTADVWVYEPAEHKNTHRGLMRTIFIPTPVAQQLDEYLRVRPLAGMDQVFTPRESAAWHNAQKSLESKGDEKNWVLTERVRSGELQATEAAEIAGVHPQTVRSWVKTSARPKSWRECTDSLTRRKLEYTRHSYRNGTLAACKSAGIEHFCPYEIRHSTAEYLDEKFGIEAVAAILGHQSVSTSRIYAKRNTHLARKIASEMNVFEKNNSHA